MTSAAFPFLVLLTCPAVVAAGAFEENRGQTDAAVQYFAKSAGGQVFFTRDAVTLHRKSGSTLEFRFERTRGDAAWTAVEPLSETTSYFIGRDPSRWVRDARSYNRLYRRGLYAGIDATFYQANAGLEYDLILSPRANPGDVRMRVSGARKLTIDASGDLIAETGDGILRQRRPLVYQIDAHGAKEPVEGRFRLLARDLVGFEVGSHDAKLPLSIDPVLESSTYLGGSADDAVVYYDGTNVVGSTSSIDFPNSTVARRSGLDVFVKFAGATYIIGGSGNDVATCATLYGFGIWVAGYTDSQDLPTSLAINTKLSPSIPWQANFGGGATDGFLMFIPNLTTGSSNLPQSAVTYIGGPGDDRVTAIYASSRIYLTGTTSAGGLPTSPVASTPFAPQPSGGLDGFLITAGAGSITIPLYSTYYFGGSGDDRPLAIYQDFNQNLYIAGETSSPDFPQTAAQPANLNGPSDAFVMKLAQPSVAVYTLTTSMLFGGSGADRITSIAPIPNGIAFAGTTSSTDLPTMNAIQNTFGGGGSDGFIAQFSSDLSQLTSSTYYGGSGDDRVLAMTSDAYGSLFVGGSTSSQDFPVTSNAVQSLYGGGSSDGFLLHFDVGGTLYHATYYGGSGDDQVLGLYTAGNASVYLGGRTTSTDLPLVTPAQLNLKGNSDGFLAWISDNLILAAPIVNAKDQRVTAPIGVGRLNGSVAGAVTVSSGDPSSVQLAVGQSDTGQGSITVPASTGSIWYFYVDCVTDSGGTDLTISAPGYPDRIAHVTCYPLTLVPTFYPVSAVISLWATNASLSLSPAVAQNGATSPIVLNSVTRPGATSPSLQISSSNPSVGGLSAATISLPSASLTNGGILYFTPLSTGTTTLNFTSQFLLATSSIAVTVISPISQPVPFAVPMGFQRFTGFGFSSQAPTGASFPLTVTSGDPTRVVVSADPTLPGQASATQSATSGAEFCIQALGSGGTVPLTISAPGLDPVTASVQLSAPVLLGPGTQPPSTIGIDESFYLTYYVAAASNGSTGFTPNPGGAPLQVTLTNSNPSAVSAPASAALTPGTLGTPAQFQVKGIAAGSTTLTVADSGGVPLDPATTQPLNLTVISRPLTMKGVEVGKDLAASMILNLPANVPTGAAITIVSSDPTSVLLAPVAGAVGLTQISGTVQNPQSLATTYTFWVQGLKASGTAQVTATVAGFGSVSASVTLDPSGFGWSADSTTFTMYASNNVYPTVISYALDATTLLPVAAQTLRGGVSASWSATTSNAGVVTFGTGISIVGPGSATLTLAGPAGFSVPSSRQTLVVTVVKANLVLSPVTLGKDMQTSFSPPSYEYEPVPYTITSSDPTKVLVSTDQTVTGTASVTTKSGSLVYLQALDSQGVVNITVSAPGYNNGSTTVTLYSLGLGLSVNAVATPANGTYTTTTASPASSISASLTLVDQTGKGYGSVNPQFRPGIAPIPVQLTVANPSVGTLTGSATQSISNGTSTPPTFSFQPIAAGDTTVSATQPPGFVAPPTGTITFHVTPPSVQGSNMTMGQDSIQQAAISLQTNVSAPNTNVTVTVTSTDPSRVLLSRDANTPGTASVTTPLVAGQTSPGSVYVQALGNSGTVPVTIQAPGYADSSFNVNLYTLGFFFNNFGNNTYVPQNGPQNVTIVPGFNGTSGGVTIRPGAPDIDLTLNTSNSAVVSVPNPQVVFHAGNNSAQTTFVPVSAGTATLSLTAPDPYVINPAQNQLKITVNAPALSVLNVTVGRDFQTSMSISAPGNFGDTPVLTITSSDPTRVLLAPDGQTPGQASITLPTKAGSSPNIYVQALADNGTVTVTASASGYQSGVAQVNLTPSAAIFGAMNTVNLYTTSGVQTYAVTLTALDPLTLKPVNYVTPSVRPGATLTVNAISSNPNVAIADATPISLSGAVPSYARITPAGPGTAIISLGPLSNGGTAASEQEFVMNVSAPPLVLQPFQLGVNLQAPVQISLDPSQPTPASDVTLTVTGNDNSVPISVSNTASGSNYSIPVTLHAATRMSDVFYVQAGGTTGIGTFQYQGGPYPLIITSIQIVPSGLAITTLPSPVTQLTLSSGSAANAAVVPIMLPPGTASTLPLLIRGNIPATISSSAPGVAVVSPQSVTVSGTGAQFIITGVAAGSATISLATPSTFDVSNVEAHLDVIVK